MRSGVVMGVLWARLAVADPAFDACKEERRALTARAMTVADAARRGELLAAMPICRRAADGQTEVVAAPPPPVVDTSPFSRFVLGADVGATVAYIDGLEAAHAGFGPTLEITAGARPVREIALAGYLRYTRLAAHGVFVSAGEAATPIGPVDGGTRVDVIERLYGAGARATRRFHAVAFSGELGLAIDDGIDYRAARTRYALLELGFAASYRLAHVGASRVELVVAYDQGIALHRSVTAIRAGLGFSL